ncbi:MAG TPA: VOC family protein [Chloroflexota bacterium]|nr:VOC family protein [Chloroflexota bacterium]
MSVGTEHSLATGRIVAFAATTNADAARAFYGEVLGLRLVSDDGFAVVFDANGTMVRVQKVDAVTLVPYTSLGWQVDDIAAVGRRLVERGVRFERYAGLEQDELGVWTAPRGARVAWFKDPEGNILSITQF